MGSYLFMGRQRHLYKMLKRYGSIDFSQDVMNIMNEYGNNEDDYDINLGKKKGETNLIVDYIYRMNGCTSSHDKSRLKRYKCVFTKVNIYCLLTCVHLLFSKQKIFSFICFAL